MNHDEFARELLKIIDKLLNLLTLQTGAEFVFEDTEAAGEEISPSNEVDLVAGYALSNTWELEDEIIRDPVPPNIGDPEE